MIQENQQTKKDPQQTNQENPQQAKTVIPTATKQAILEAMRATYRRPFDIDGTTVWVHSLPALGFSQYGASLERNAEGDVNDNYANEKLVQRCVRDENDKLYFNLSDVTLLAEAKCHIWIPLVNLCNEVNGIGPAAAEAIAKN